MLNTEQLQQIVMAKKTTSNWMFLPGSEKITEIHSGQEYGWTLAYEREV